MRRQRFVEILFVTLALVVIGCDGEDTADSGSSATVDCPAEMACDGLECGLDPRCGLSCGSCSDGNVCDDGICVEEGTCVPDCEWLECGPDPVCGESCGTCGDNQMCDSGECVVDNTPGELVWIKLPGGAFEMGCVADGYQCGSEEQPLHTVILQGFRILETEVTEGQYEAVMGTNPSWNKLGVDFPVESLDWYQAKEFCEAVGGSLPREAEWEYAARAGATTKFYCGDDEACLDGIAWTQDNADGKQPVKGKAPNDFGLYDMTGNVWEWTADWMGDYMEGPIEDPVGPGDGLFKVTRGGAVDEPGAYGYHRLSERYGIFPETDDIYLGFRCVKGLELWELEE